MRDVKNGKDSAQLVSAIQERIECFHVFWSSAIQAVPIAWDAAAIAPNNPSTKALIRRENCPHPVGPTSLIICESFLNPLGSAESCVRSKALKQRELRIVSGFGSGGLIRQIMHALRLILMH